MLISAANIPNYKYLFVGDTLHYKEGCIFVFGENTLWKIVLFITVKQIAPFNMSSTLPTLDPFYDQSKPFSELELSKSLQFLGFGAWGNLEPGNW